MKEVFKSLVQILRSVVKEVVITIGWVFRDWKKGAGLKN